MSIVTPLLSVAVLASVGATPVEHRGIWLHPKQYLTKADCEQFVARMAAARINVAYALVWYHGGQGTWRSDMCVMPEGVEPGFDPLAYLVEQCHAHGIQVHAWFVNGSVGGSKLYGPLEGHTDWLVQTSPGQIAWWWDLGQPQVREFQKNLMLDVLRRVDIDALHFDYIRYNGRMLCFCDHCVREFKRLYGHDLRALAGDRFPLAAQISGNPVDKPTTAQVLVRVAEGPPAIALNRVGKGQVLLLNWHAYRLTPAAVNTVVRRFLASVGVEDKAKVLLYRPQATVAKYGTRAVGQVSAWLRGLGFATAWIRDRDLASLTPPGVVVIVGAYYFPEEQAAQILNFVREGGAAIVMDGPVYSIKYPSVSQLLGFEGTAPFYSGFMTLVPVAPSELVPAGGKAVSKRVAAAIGADWAAYRKAGVSKLVASVFREAKTIKPDVAVTAAVFRSKAAADAVFQDWPRWLRDGFIDYVLPMAYVMENDTLAELLDEWKTIDPHLERIIPGLSLYRRDKSGKALPRPPELVLSQVELCRKAGARGVNFFALAYLDEAITSALTSGPFKEPAKPYVPLIRGR